ncbi:hypothetical protein ACWEOH_10235 [Agromyces sp. NPDC004153]
MVAVAGVHVVAGVAHVVAGVRVVAHVVAGVRVVAHVVAGVVHVVTGVRIMVGVHVVTGVRVVLRVHLVARVRVVFRVQAMLLVPAVALRLVPRHVHRSSSTSFRFAAYPLGVFSTTTTGAIPFPIRSIGGAIRMPRHPTCRIGAVAVQPGSRSENMGDCGIRRVL